MAKTKTPFFSMGSRGTVGGVLTSQKRGSATLLRETPIPTDPYSLAQAYQRWLYRDYAYLWTLQTNATKQTYRSRASRYHITGFSLWMREYLRDLPDIVAWWRLDEKTGALAYDSSRNNHNATIIGASPSSLAIDGALYLDGINDFLTVPYTGTLILNSPFSFEMFIKPLDTGANIMLLSCRAMPGYVGNWVSWISPARLLRVVLNLTSGGVAATHTVPLPWDTLHHIGFSYDDPTLILYINGIGQTFVTAGGSLVTNPSTLYMGTREDLTLDFKGYYDNIILHSRALDSTEFLRHSLRRYPA